MAEEDKEQEGATGEEAAEEELPTRLRKPSRSPEWLVAKLKGDGVTYNLVSEEDAADFLRNANNYLRTASYRKLYPKQIEGESKGKYVNLDFAYLEDLSSIDQRFRTTFRAVSDDIEHFAGMKLKRRSEEEGEGGYALVQDYLDGLGADRRKRLLGSLRRRAAEGDLRDAGRLARLKADVEARSRCYGRNEALASYFDFAWRLIDIWAPNPS